MVAKTSQLHLRCATPRRFPVGGASEVSRHGLNAGPRRGCNLLARSLGSKKTIFAEQYKETDENNKEDDEDVGILSTVVEAEGTG